MPVLLAQVMELALLPVAPIIVCVQETCSLA